MPENSIPDLPPRFEPRRRLGGGGGGEVWAAADGMTGRDVAVKLLGNDAGEDEHLALVREAVALSGLEGMGLPRVLAFGVTPKSRRRYLVRELLAGMSLEDWLSEYGDEDSPLHSHLALAWLVAVADVASQLTVIHRMDILHGDVKPANVIVSPEGRGSLVDLGLSAPFRREGVTPVGLTPKFAAPELLRGEALTVRSEVFSLGATLGYALAVCGDGLADECRIALSRIVARATESEPARRFPSADEVGAGLRPWLPDAARTADAVGAGSRLAWPIRGMDALYTNLRAALVGPDAAPTQWVVGPPGAGKRTLARRLAWSLGAEGVVVEHVEGRFDAPREAEEPSSVQGPAAVPPRGGPDVVVLAGMSSDVADAWARVRGRQGARIIAFVEAPPEGARRVVPIAPLSDEEAVALVRGAMPSASAEVASFLARRAEGRPGKLRELVKSLADATVSSIDDAARWLDGRDGGAAAVRSPGDRLAEYEGYVERGRAREAETERRALDPLLATVDETMRLRAALATVGLLLLRGELDGARDMLRELDAPSRAQGLGANWLMASARCALRGGDHGAVLLHVEELFRQHPEAFGPEAMAIRGLAHAYSDDEPRAHRDFEAARRAAQATSDSRVRGIVCSYEAIAHQRAGRTRDAAACFEEALLEAERSGDAGVRASALANLAILAQSAGDYATALERVEAAVDAAERAGNRRLLSHARLNLANLDLYLGRYARARATLDALRSAPSELVPQSAAQLEGLFAEWSARTGDGRTARAQYRLCGDRWAALGRKQDAAEAYLESLVVALRTEAAALAEVRAELTALEAALGQAGFGEHEALYRFVLGMLLVRTGDDGRGLSELQRAAELAADVHRTEWIWQVREEICKVHIAQGNGASARRERDAALAIVEETASKLPRDLREVFWDDPRRRGLTKLLPDGASSLHGGVGAAAQGVSITGGGARSSDERLRRLLAVNRNIARERDLSRVLDQVAEHAMAIAGADRAYVLLATDDGGWEVHAQRDRLDAGHAEFSRSVASEVVESGQPVVTLSAGTDSRFRAAASVHALRVQSIACVPIRGLPPAERTIGALYVETRGRLNRRLESELDLLSAFADQAAIGIDHARLHEELWARAAELQRTNESLERAHAKLSEVLERRTEQLTEARASLRRVRAELRSRYGYGALVGQSPAMRRLYAVIDRVKETDVPVLLLGESGTGKEVVARTIHDGGPRARGPFVGINCGAIPANLLEAELFGHTRGAFTGADRDRKGILLEAQGGTVLLDEIGELPEKMQAALLRVLQEKAVRPLGASEEVPIDVRVIAATHRDLAALVRERKFREDLFYRLQVVNVDVPPLRDRAGDIPLLVDHFLTVFSARYDRPKKTVSRDAFARLSMQHWPGNVRQLENALLGAWLLSEGDEIQVSDLALPADGSPTRGSETVGPSCAIQPGVNAETRKVSERQRILAALEASSWNRLRAAQLVGLPRRTFYRRLKEYGIL